MYARHLWRLPSKPHRANRDQDLVCIDKLVLFLTPETHRRIELLAMCFWPPTEKGKPRLSAAIEELVMEGLGVLEHWAATADDTQVMSRREAHELRLRQYQAREDKKLSGTRLPGFGRKTKKVRRKIDSPGLLYFGKDPHCGRGPNGKPY